MVGSGLTESLFSAHKEEYPEHEQASLKQLYQAKVYYKCFVLYLVFSSRFYQELNVYALQMEELRAENQQVPESSGTIGRSKGASISTSPQQISVTVVTEFVRWNEEAISRSTLFSSQVIFVASINSLCIIQ